MAYFAKKKSWKNGHFWTKTMGNPLLKNIIFPTFWTSCFYSLERRFFVLDIVKEVFLAYIALKKSWKNGHVLNKTICSAFWKNVSFSTFWISCFYSLETRFIVLEYRKRHFPGLYCLRRNVGKMAIFGPIPWINSFGKPSIFRLFELLVFIA